MTDVVAPTVIPATPPTNGNGTPRAIDVIRQSTTDQRRSIVVSEWGGLEMFFSRLTSSDIASVGDRDPKSPQERNLILLIHKARDREGRPLFQMGDLHYLMTEADWFVLQKVVTFMYESSYGGDLERAVEVLRENPSSASASA